MRRPEVHPYADDWRDRGGELAADLRRLLGVRVEHIGSTSIPGMASKPVFDLQASVHDLDAAAAAFAAPLAGLGFEARPYDHDHVPAGLDDDPERWAKRYFTCPDANLHVRLIGSPNERLALLFRDWFRAHPAAVPAYGRFKRELARAVAGIEVYTDIKDPVVDVVIVAAEEWAAATGWRP